MFVPTATRYTQTCIWLNVTRGKYESRSLDDDVYTLKKYEYLAGDFFYLFIDKNISITSLHFSISELQSEFDNNKLKLIIY